MNVKNRYALLFLITGQVMILFGAMLKVQQNSYTNFLFIAGLGLSLVGAVIFVINMYHKR
ncbi:hypothetical protein GCM10023091_17380 [Ravibacter arvi]|uniref:Uncharacterized protein n=1 Tax=Ravibacter arvi TaxID=2051041 RepID=A0ABP8LWW5_9BACT